MIHIDIDPILFRWGAIAIGWHGLWLAASVFIAYQAFTLEGRRKGIDHHYLSELILWTAILGYIGARLLHVLDHWQVYAAQPARILAVHKGGLALYGALIGGTIATVGYARWKNLSFWYLADAIAVMIPMGEIVGRVGCTINGDVAGVPIQGSWGLVYWHPNASIPAYLLGVPTFPAPTMLQIWNVGLLALFLVLRKRLHLSGSLFLTCMIAYSLGRFIVSIWQPGEPLLFGLKKTQALSLAIISLGILLLLYLRTQASSSSHASSNRQNGSGTTSATP
jgi:phosphatidylglycerol:prolipoprotein diacylglycerol transferase